MKTVAHYPSLMDAQLAKNCLELEGIDSFIQDSILTNMAWHLTNAIGGIRLEVRDEDHEQALAALERASVPWTQRPLEEESLGEEAADAAPESGAVASQQDDETIPLPTVLGDLARTATRSLQSASDAAADRAYRGAIIGLIFLPVVFHLLSAWHVVKALKASEPLSVRGRRRLTLAIFFDVIIFSLVGVMMMLFWETLSRTGLHLVYYVRELFQRFWLAAS